MRLSAAWIAFFVDFRKFDYTIRCTERAQSDDIPSPGSRSIHQGDNAEVEGVPGGRKGAAPVHLGGKVLAFAVVELEGEDDARIRLRSASILEYRVG